MIRSILDVNVSIEQLEQNKFTCSPFDAFGFDNLAKIDVMIEVMRMDRSLAWINSTFLTTDELLESQPDNVLWQSATDARAWLDGSLDLPDLLFPDKKEKKFVID